MHKPMFFLALLTFFAGLIISLTLRANADLFTPSGDLRYKELISYIEELEEENADISDQINQVRGQIGEIQNNQGEEEGVLLGLQKNLDMLKLTGGYLEVEGPGIIIILDDNQTAAEIARKNNPDSYYPEDYIIHDKNLLYILKALAGRIEAVAINNQRIVDNSNIRCVGTVVMVDSFRLAPPYEIKIIGDPSLLEAAVTSCGEYLPLKTKEMINVIQSENLTLPAYTGSSSYLYGQSIKN